MAAAADAPRCPNCNLSDLEYSEPDGATVCMNCFMIVEENAIVSSVEFNENNAGGSSTVVGQFVGPEMTKAYSSGGRGRRRFYARDSRETTINNGRRCIQQVVSQLHLKPSFVDRAARLFRTAVERNFVQGRKTMCVVAVCLYMVCREESSPHMLLDFSDAVQINVYKLGHAFLRFKALTGINVPNIDPCIYIHRFASKLELTTEQDQAKVCALALRLVATMQRDWIQAGRRPSGLCGAALHIATCYHGQARSIKDIARILRVSSDTIKKRFDEVQASKFAGRISLDQLAHMSNQDFDSHVYHAEEADPPSFTRNQKRGTAGNGRGAGRGGRRLLALTYGGLDDDDDEDDDDEVVLSAAATGPARKKGRGGDKDGNAREQLYRGLMDQIMDEEEGRVQSRGVIAQHQPAAFDQGPAPGTSLGWAIGEGDGPPGDVELQNENRAQPPVWSSSVLLPGMVMDDDDTDQYIRTAEERENMSLVWHEVNKPYLEKQKQKKAEQEEAKRRAENDFSYRPPTGSGGRKRGANGQLKQDGTAAGGGGAPHAPHQAPAPKPRRVSKKINYEAVEKMAAPQLPDDLPPEFEGLIGFPAPDANANDSTTTDAAPPPPATEGTAAGASSSQAGEGGAASGKSVLLGRARREEEDEEEEEDDDEDDDDEEEEEEPAEGPGPRALGEETIEGEIEEAEEYEGGHLEDGHDYDDCDEGAYDDDEEY